MNEWLHYKLIQKVSFNIFSFFLNSHSHFACHGVDTINNVDRITYKQLNYTLKTHVRVINGWNASVVAFGILSINIPVQWIYMTYIKMLNVNVYVWLVTVIIYPSCLFNLYNEFIPLTNLIKKETKRNISNAPRCWFPSSIITPD